MKIGLPFFAGMAIARGKNLPSRTAFTDGLLASAFSPSLLGIALVGAIARNQANSLGAAVTSGTAGTLGSTGAGYIGGSAGSGAEEAASYRNVAYSRLQNYGTMPSFIGIQGEQAARLAALLGLDVRFQGDADRMVVSQVPAPEKWISDRVLILITE